MIKKRLVQIVPDSKKYIAGNVLFQWIALISNIVFMTMITSFIATLAVTKNITACSSFGCMFFDSFHMQYIFSKNEL